jgi:hypothetical protein
METQTWTAPADIESQWRPLRDDEAERVPGLIGLVERYIRRTWRDTQERIDSGELGEDDVKDVVIWAVVPMLTGDPEDVPPQVKSWQETSGSESVSYVLEGSVISGMLVFTGWMVDVFEGAGRSRKSGGAEPRGSFPMPGMIEGLFDPVRYSGFTYGSPR